jgi:hypothetical protein
MRGRHRIAGIAAISAALVFGSLAAAQETAQPKWYILHQELARPGMVKQYEDTTKDFIAAVRQHRDTLPTFDFVGISGDDFVYTYVSQIDNFAEMDKINAGFGALIKAVGEAKWGDLMKRGGAATEYIRESIVMEDPSLSYTPAKPRLKPEEERYLHVDLYYVQPGREPEADALSREFVELFRSKGVTDGYRLFKVWMGPEMPLIIVTSPAKDATDYATRDAANQGLLGAEGQALFQRAFSLCRRIERHNGWIRPDLSLEPMQAAQGK